MNRRGLLKALGLGALAVMVPLPDVSGAVNRIFATARHGVMSDRLENQILDHVFRGMPMAARGVVYVALFTSYDKSLYPQARHAPGEPGGLAEINHAWYRRQRVFFSPAKDGKSFNLKDIYFPKATTRVRVTHAAIMEKRLRGERLFGPYKLAQDKWLLPEDVFAFFKGELFVEIELEPCCESEA